MENDKPTKELWWKPAAAVFIKTSGWIAGPIILALILGKYLDNRLGSTPWFFFGFIAIAFVISMLGIGFMLKKQIK
jgi:F0F1-type ATP synthase assembly protein I